jgi:hypothetical protein
LGESGHQREGIDLSWGSFAIDGEESHPSASFSNKMLFFVKNHLQTLHTLFDPQA